MALSEAERDALRRMVVEERTRTAARLAALEQTFAELVAAADLEPPDDEHDPDGTTAYERAQVTSLAAEARVRLAELDAALAADSGLAPDAGLGTCAACGGEIGWERLQALSGTRHCVACVASGAASP